VVITSVTRDDLADGGAGHFARTIQAVRQRLPQAVIEVLTPDFQGRAEAIDAVLAARPDIFNHNVETVPRLYPTVRPEADYRRSLDVLAHAKRWAHCHSERAERAKNLAPDGVDGCPTGETLRCAQGDSDDTPGPDLFTKSGLMVGLGETAGEVSAVMRDLRAAGCDILTIGQYLAPSAAHVPVVRFVEPAEFAAWEAEARALGFAAAAAGPFVRSSYQAENVFLSRNP
jgi:lipoic acid synthetase